MDFATSDYGATAGVDYTTTNGTLAFAAGESMKFITVNIIADTTFERAEMPSRCRTPAYGESIPGPPATGTIRNDDATLELATLTSGDGFTITGAITSGYTGYSVSGGDLNGDGFAELFIGVRQGGNGYGAVVFGSSSPTDLDTGALTASEGFNLTGYEYADPSAAA